jgi:hypothetical protein
MEVGQTQRPFVEIVDEKGQSRAVLGCTSLRSTVTDSVEQRPPSSLVLFNHEGKVVFDAP